MKVKVELLIADSRNNEQHLFFDAELKSECSLCTDGGKIYFPHVKGMVVDCMPEIRKEN